MIQRISLNVQEQRRSLTNWLMNTPAAKKQVQLGSLDEAVVQTHLQVLDGVIEKADNQSLGICEVCHESIEPGRLEMDYTCCVCLDHLSAEEKERLEYELEFSSKIQQALMPQQIPDILGLDLAAYSRPAEIVGGDYFDFFRFQDQAQGLIIGDVMGHGISASILMASLQASLHTLVQDNDSPEEVVHRLNLLFNHNVHLTHFVTLFLARFDSQSRNLSYCNAGHNPPLLFRTQSNENQPIIWLNPTGAAIGLVEEIQYREEIVTLAHGDILIFYTDGVTEAINPQEEEFGQERLADLVQKNSHWPAKELVQGMRLRLQEFTHGQPLADDTTIVACKIEGQ